MMDTDPRNDMIIIWDIQRVRYGVKTHPKQSDRQSQQSMRFPFTAETGAMNSECSSDRQTGSKSRNGSKKTNGAYTCLA